MHPPQMGDAILKKIVGSTRETFHRFWHSSTVQQLFNMFRTLLVLSAFLSGESPSDLSSLISHMKKWFSQLLLSHP